MIDKQDLPISLATANTSTALSITISLPSNKAASTAFSPLTTTGWNLAISEGSTFVAEAPTNSNDKSDANRMYNI